MIPYDMPSTKRLESPHDPAERTVTLMITVVIGSDDPDEDGRDVASDIEDACSKAGIEVTSIEVDGVSAIEE